MGKCKRRTFSRTQPNILNSHLTRTEAIRAVMKKMEKNPASNSAKKIISLFGITAEELSESGMTYEVLRSLDGILN